MVAVVGIKVVHLLKELDLDAGLRTEGRLVLDDLDGNFTLVMFVNSLHDLPEGALAEELPHLVPLEPDFAWLHDVVVIFVIIAAIEGILFCKCPFFRVIHLRHE